MVHGLSPSLLIASPRMVDPFFERTVVLVWSHSELEGAMGLVINRTLDHTLPEVLDLDQLDLTDYANNAVVWGGPVETTSGTVITPAVLPMPEGGIVLPTGISITRSAQSLVQLIEQRKPLILAVGYAGWGPGQLDREIQEGGWLFTDCTAEIVFGTPVEDRYDKALASLGLTASIAWMAPVDE